MTSWRTGISTPKLSWDEMVESFDLEAALDALGLDILGERRGSFQAHCPLPDHPGANTSGNNFSVKQDEDGVVWNCLVCNEGGKLPSLVVALQGLEDEPDQSAWQQALAWLSQFADVGVTGEANEREEAVARGRRSRSRSAHRLRPDLPVFGWRSVDQYPLAPLDLLEKWHIADEEVIEDFGIRYDEEHEERGYVGPALIIPHVFGGDLVGYQRRWLSDDRPKKIPKYDNSEGFPKKETLFNWDVALAAAGEGENILVVESAMTVVRLACLDRVAVATFGGSISARQIRMLSRLRAGLTLAYDADTVGDNALDTLVDALGGSSRIAPLLIVPAAGERKSDLADLGDSEALEALEEAIEYDPIGH